MWTTIAEHPFDFELDTPGPPRFPQADAADVWICAA
jgi:hypothetical protein